MKLLTKVLRERLLLNGRVRRQVEKTAEPDFIPVVKLFTPDFLVVVRAWSPRCL